MANKLGSVKTIFGNMLGRAKKAQKSSGVPVWHGLPGSPLKRKK